MEHTFTINQKNLYEVLMSIEHLFDVRIAAITRGDVNDEFRQTLLAEDIEERDMTPEEWDKFANEWFWRKGHYEIFWDGVSDAVRWDLREAGLIPETAICE